MSENVHQVLEKYEKMMSGGQVVSFIVHFKQNELTLKPSPVHAADSVSVKLSPELSTSLQLFFSGAENIVAGTPGYATLRSLVNAHETFRRIRTKQDGKA